MDAKKCDRCGEFYDVQYGVKDYSINKHISFAWEALDLCPRCYN